MAKESNIIKTIQDMLRAGESEESIIKALKEMGISEDQAKRLLGIAQADTLALLQAEIGKIVREQLENNMPMLQTHIDKEILKIREDILSIARSEVRGAIKELRTELKDDIKLLHDVAENQNTRLSSLEEKLATLREEVKELHMRRLASRNEWLALMLVFGGLSFIVTSLYLVFNQWPLVSADLIVMVLTLCVSGIAMLFSASVI